MLRRPIHPAFDATLGLHPRRAIGEHAYAIVKLTYGIVGGQARLRAPEPLGPAPHERPVTRALAPHDEHALFRPGTDVIVLGDAWWSRPQRRGRVTVTVGPASSSIEVMGPRRASWSKRRGARFEEPAPVRRTPVVMGNAYGGWDPRVPLPDPRSLPEALLARVDHPGVYPRNPVGKGYVVVPEPVEDVWLPTLEHPDDRLTPERFVVGDPARWWQQPRPAFLGFCLANAFGRSVHLGIDPWFPPPDDERMPEVATGELAPGFRRSRHDPLATIDPRFFHEAPASLSLPRLRPGDLVVVTGMHPRHERIGFAVPPPPALCLELEGRELAATPRLGTLVVRPAEHVATATWVLRADRLPRRFIPEVHAEIPLALRVDGVVVPYAAPPTLRERLTAAGAPAGAS